MDSNSVVKCDERKALEILRSNGVLERMQSYPDRVLVDDVYLVNDRLLLVLVPISDTATEAHIASPRQHWHNIHADITESLKFIVDLGYNSVYTNIPLKLKKTINLVMKHGFYRINEYNGEAILRWESKQQL